MPTRPLSDRFRHGNWCQKKDNVLAIIKMYSLFLKNRILRPLEAFENLYALKKEGIPCVNEESVFPLYALLLAPVTIHGWHKRLLIVRPCPKAAITSALWVDARFYWVVA